MGALQHMRPDQPKAPDRPGTKKKGGYRKGSGNKPGSNGRGNGKIPFKLVKKLILAGERAKRKYGGVSVEDRLFGLIYSDDPKDVAYRCAAIKLYYEAIAKSDQQDRASEEAVEHDDVVFLPELKVM